MPGTLGVLTRRNAASLVDEHWRSTMDELIGVLERVREEVAPETVPGSAGDPPVPTSTAPSFDDDAGSGRPARSKRRVWAIVAGVAALVVVAGAAAAMSGGGGGGDGSPRASNDHTTTSPKASTTTRPTTTSSTLQLQVGDCVTANATSSSSALPCSEPHTQEVTLVTTYPAGANDPWPGVDTFRAFADPICTGAFTAYVGVPQEESQYIWTWLYPTESEWASGSRAIQCAVTTSAGTPTNGSVRGSRS
jgi:hypothetical protein